MIRQLTPFWKPAKRDTLLGILALIAGSAAELLAPWPIQWLVDYVFGNKPAPAWAHNLWPATIGPQLALLSLAIVLFALTHKVLMLVAHQFLIRAGNVLVLELRSRACAHLHKLPLAYHEKTRVGDSLYRMAYDTCAAQSLISQGLAPIVAGALLLVGVTLVMLQVDPLLTLIALAVVPLFWISIRAFGKIIERRAQVYRQHESALAEIATESLGSIRAVQAFGQENLIQSAFTSRASGSFAANQKLAFTQLLFSMSIGLIMALGMAAVVYVGASRVAAGHLSTGAVLVFIAYVGMLYQPINAFSQSANVIHSAKSQLQRVFDLLALIPSIAETPNALRPASVRGLIEFDNASFEYEPDRPALRDLSLRIEPGRIVALVGRTGSGKTTLTNMLLRFYDPTAGSVRLDGTDLRDLSLSWLRQNVSVVLQDAILFSGTIADNIAYGKTGATPSEISAAAEKAQADAFIRSLPQQYQTPLGERGVNLSGGQRQRISIARAFLRNAPILILDEPTSAVDAHTEDALVEAITKLSQGRTTFIVAHRLSTVRLADTIIVLDEGRIIEHGTHDELIARRRAYFRLYQAQFRTEGSAHSGSGTGLEDPLTDPPVSDESPAYRSLEISPTPEGVSP